MISSHTISVVMPVYNDAPFLNEAIDSILNQTFEDFELIIINDASTDKSAEIISRFKDKRIILLNNQENSGISKSLNRGIDISNGKYIARIDGNDVALPNRLNVQYKFIKKIFSYFFNIFNTIIFMLSIFSSDNLWC